MSHRRVCPVCVARYGAYVDPGCPVCGGHGMIVLGRRLVKQEEPQIICKAIGMYLGWVIEAPESDARHRALEACANALRAAGFMETPEMIHPSLKAVPDPPKADQQRMARVAGQLAREMGVDVDAPTEAEVVSLDDVRKRRSGG